MVHVAGCIKAATCVGYDIPSQVYVAVLLLRSMSLFSIFSVYMGVVEGVVTERNSSALSVSDESRKDFDNP